MDRKIAVRKGIYGQRPLWQWVIIYAVIAIIVYGLIYFLFIQRGTGLGY